MIINKLKTYALVMAVAGATVTTSMAAAIQYASTNLFQPLTVTLSVYQQKAISSTADTIETGASASFKTANLLTAVTNTLVKDAAGNSFVKNAVLGFVTYETNSEPNTNNPILGTNVVYSATNTVDLSTNILPLLTTTSNDTILTNSYTVTTNSAGASGSTNGTPSTNVTFVGGFTNSGAANGTTGSVLALGDSGSNTITITATNGVTNIVVTQGTNAPVTYTNLSDVTLSPDGSATFGTNSTTVETNLTLGGTNESVDTNSVSVITNGTGFTNLTISTNAVSISYSTASVTNGTGTNAVTNTIDNAVLVAVGTTSVKIYTNVTGGTNYDYLAVTSGTNATVITSASNTAPFTNVVAIGSDVLVSNGVIAGFGTNTVASDTLTTSIAVVASSGVTVSTNYVATTNFSTNSGVTNTVITTNQVISTVEFFDTNAVVVTSTTNFTSSNETVIEGYTYTNRSGPAGPPVLVVEEPIGKGTTASFLYTEVPPSVLTISNTPSTNEAIVAAFKTTTTNFADYAIKTLILNGTNVSLTAQGLVHSTADYVSVTTSVTGKKIIATNEAWTDVSGYGSNALGPMVVGGTAAVGTPAAQKQQ